MFSIYSKELKKRAISIGLLYNVLMDVFNYLPDSVMSFSLGIWTLHILFQIFSFWYV